MTQTPQPPALEYAGTLSVLIGDPIDVGPTPEGHRRIIPITGGAVSGPRLSGRVLPGGGRSVGQKPVNRLARERDDDQRTGRG